jgi:transcription elongation factor GreA
MGVLLMADIYLTEEGLAKLEAELKELKAIKRPLIIKAIQEARAHGDLSENAEYDAAKEAQAFNERRISELEDQFSRAKVIDATTMPSDKVCVGKMIKIKNLGTGEANSYRLVSVEEADFANGKLAITSPIGRAFVGRMVGDEVDIKVPSGNTRYKLLGMSM